MVIYDMSINVVAAFDRGDSSFSFFTDHVSPSALSLKSVSFKLLVRIIIAMSKVLGKSKESQTRTV